MHIGFWKRSNPCTTFRVKESHLLKRSITCWVWREIPQELTGVKASITWHHDPKRIYCSKTCPTNPQTSRSHFSGPGPCRAAAIRLSIELISTYISGGLLTFIACTPSLTNEWFVFLIFSCSLTPCANRGDGGTEESNPWHTFWDEVVELSPRGEKATRVQSRRREWKH